MDLWNTFEIGQPLWLLSLLLLLPSLWYAAQTSRRAMPRRQQLLVFIVRTVIIICIVLSLCDIRLVRPSHQTMLVFAVDASHSVDPDSRHTAREWIRAATQSVDDEHWRWFEFAATARLPASRDSLPANTRNDMTDDGMRDSGGSGADGTVGWNASTNLEEAIEAARAATPPGWQTHVVLLSDGNETTGSVWNAAQRAGIRISTVTLAVRPGPELQLTAINTPSRVARNAPYNIEVVADAAQDDHVLIELFRGDTRIAAEQRAVTKGENRFLFVDQTDRTEKLSARLTPVAGEPRETPRTSGDTRADNNEAVALVTVAASPKVLLLDSEPQHASHLRRALRAEGIDLDVQTAAGVPNSIADLQIWDAIVIGNLPATAFTTRQMELLRTYVSILGRGLLMLGSEQTFGLGGYYQTTIEELLPVRSDFEKENEQPGLGLVLIIDRSGSMGGPKIALARKAARGAVELLSENDQVGVLAFDGTTSWISRLAPLTSAADINDRIASIRADGGTSLFPAMQEAYAALRGTTARLKHVIILTDGYSTPGDFEDLTSQMASRRITVSTIGIGDADRDLLERIAQLGGGRYYFTDDPDSIPQIFARETITAGKSAINEDPFLPLVLQASPMLTGIDMESAPFLLGYVATRPKPTSEVLLATETGDPLLSWWRYGLGITAAFTSDAGGRWSSEWVTWDSYSRFWAQIVRQLIRPTDNLPVSVSVRQRDGVATIEVEASTLSGDFLNGADVVARVIGPDLSEHSLPLAPIAPGRYRGQLGAADPGVWMTQISVTDGGEVVHEQSAGFVVRSSQETQLMAVNATLLSDVARLTGGVHNPEPAAVANSKGGPAGERVIPIRPWLMITAIVLFVADVFLRRCELPWLRETAGRDRERNR